MDFFRGAPDFSEQTTAYQVAHIYDREYTPSDGKLKVNLVQFFQAMIEFVILNG